MKHLRMLGLAGLALVAFMAIAAASASAKATVCSTDKATDNTHNLPNGTACPGGPAGSFIYSGKIKASVTDPPGVVLQGTEDGTLTVTVTCKTSIIEGTINGTTGTGSLTVLTFGTCSAPQCSNGVTATTSASSTNPWPATATTTTAGSANGNGTLDVNNITLQFDCNIFGLHTICKYEKTEAQVDFDGNDTAPELTAYTIVLFPEAGSSSLCGRHAGLTATYKFTTPTSLWVT